MAVFPSFKLTEKGEELLNRSIGEGKTLTFTKFELGDGNPPSDFRKQTGLVNKFYEFPILNTSIQKDQVLRIRGYFDNKYFSQDKQLKEIGVFVKIEGNETQYLYSYTNAGDTGDIIPANSRGFYSRTLDVANYIGYATNITFNIEQLRDRYAFNTENEMKVASYLKAGDKVELWGNLVLGDKPTDEYIIQESGDIELSNGLFAKKVSFKYIAQTIEEIQKLALKVGDIVEVLGYYQAGDGAGHKRVIASEDDGSGILLNNGLYANVIHNGEINVSWFGAKGDGVTDDSDIIQKSINYSQNKDVILRTNQNMLINNALNLDNVTLIGNGDMILCDFDISSSISINDNVVLKNIVFKSNKRILNTINIIGNNNKICDIVVFNTEKASFTPQPPNYIKYNQGCIYVSGINNTIKGSEFYNNEGAGIYINGNYIEINNNYIHDNVSGIILDRASKDCFIENNKIINNNAVKTEGADGILSRCANLIVENNIIKGSGEHGVYLQGNNTLCIGNIVEDNERCGIKFSSVNKGVISSNVVNNNTVKQGSNESQIYLQGNCSGITISQNINLTNLNNSFFIRIVDGGSVYNGEIDIIQNKGLGNIVIGGTNKLNCLNNIVDGDIIYGSYSTINIPDECSIDGNVAKVLNLYEIKNSKVINNICDNIICTKSVNLVIGNNRIKQQTSQIDVISFKTFSKNKINVNMDKALFTTIRKVDDIEIRENEFTLTKSTRGLYEPSSESISGDRWVISRNKIKGSTQAFCNYGVNHIITENFVENNSSLGYFGCSNSIVTHNQATVSFRSGVSDNISDKNIPQNTIVQLDTPAMQYAMELEGGTVKQDYLEYSLEKSKYDKQLEAEQQAKYEAYELLLKDNPNLTWEEFEQTYGNNSIMTLSLVKRLEEPQIPESVQKFMEKYL